MKKTRTVGSTVSAQNVSLDISLPESDYNFGVVYRQVLLGKVERQETKNAFFSRSAMFCDKKK